MQLSFRKWKIILSRYAYKTKVGGGLTVKWYKIDPGIGGISSDCDDGLHVGFFDLDDWPIDLEQLDELQTAFDLSDLYILTSGPGSYHLICLDKHSLGFWYDVAMYLDRARLIDYYTVSMRRGKCILRITEKVGRPKPSLFYVMKRDSRTQRSFAHWKYLNLMYGIAKPDNLDNFDRLGIEKYITIEGRYK